MIYIYIYGGRYGNAMKRVRDEDGEVTCKDPKRSIEGATPVYVPFEWSAEQRRAISSVVDGRNTFITGPGGVGKSALIPHVVHLARTTMGKRLVCTATTGVAAIQINGTTVHQFVGFGLADKPIDVLLNGACISQKTRNRWRQTDILLIDEISMLSPEFFVKMDRIGRAMRRCLTKPFGGLQLILVGDFLQLPPVRISPPAGMLRTGPIFKYIFQTPVWKSLDMNIVKLETAFRQTDHAFVTLLNNMRYGRLTLEDSEILQTRVNAKIDVDVSIIPTVMYARNQDVDAKNNDFLIQCTGPSHVYKSICMPSADATMRSSTNGLRNTMWYEKSPPAPALLTLCVGAQVMLTVNMMELGLVNGSRGVVEEFEEDAPHIPIVRFATGRVMPIERYTWTRKDEAGFVESSYKQIPLQLAWATTIHMAQGKTLDCGELSIDDTMFENGQAYVALSRHKSLAKLTLRVFKASSVHADPVVVLFYENNCVYKV